MQRFLVTLLLASLVPAAASAAFTEVTPSTLKYEGVRYWRKKAEG